MGYTMTGTTDFANPPIIELVLGVQFSPLTKLTAGHFGLFWKELGEDWTGPADGPLIEDRFGAKRGRSSFCDNKDLKKSFVPFSLFSLGQSVKERSSLM